MTREEKKPFSIYQRPMVLEKNGMRNTTLYKVATLAETTGGWSKSSNKEDDPLGSMDPRIPEVLWICQVFSI